MRRFSFKKVAKHKVIGEGTRYVVFGLIVTIIDFTLLFAIKELILPNHYLIAALISFFVATAFSYYFNMRHVFRGYYDDIIKFRLYLIFFIITGFGLLINEIVLFRLTDFFGWYYLYSKVIASLVLIIWNFIAKKLFLFSNWAISRKYKIKPQKK